MTGWYGPGWRCSGHDAVGGTAVPDGDVAYLYRRFGLTPRVRAHTTTVAGGNGLYRREVFASVRFDPALREGEDVALNHAIERHGLSCATVPGLIVEHRENKTWGESLRWMFDSGRGATRQLLAYRQVRQPDLAAAAFGAAVAGRRAGGGAQAPRGRRADPGRRWSWPRAHSTSGAGSRSRGRTGGGSSRRSPPTARC